MTTFDLTRFGHQFDEWNARYREWCKPLDEYAEIHLFLNRDGYKIEEFNRGEEELKARLLSKYNPYIELFAMLDELCSFYLTCDSAMRTQIRKTMADCELANGAHHYADHLAPMIKGPDDVGLLRQALAAVSIEDCGSDFRDTLTSLANFYVGAEEVGLDPKPHFADVADISTDAETPGGCESVAKILREFESAAVVRERRSKGKPYRDGWN